MAVQGDSSMWSGHFPNDLMPSVIELILEVWANYELPPIKKEVPITNKFGFDLKNHNKRSKFPFGIETERQIVDDQGVVIGRIDICIRHGWDVDVYFSFECKRLRVQSAKSGKIISYSDTYIKKGMFRFFNGQYAANLDKGGMIAYVMDGKCDCAIDSIDLAIRKNSPILCCGINSGLKRSRFKVNSDVVLESCHRYGPTNEFVIQHVFLGVK